jgi:septal ring factor EnvC (AmiA/AmiB activator)
MTTYWYDPPPAPTVNGIPVCAECLRPLVGREERVCEACIDTTDKLTTLQSKRQQLENEIGDLEEEVTAIRRQIRGLNRQLAALGKEAVS